MPYDLAQLFPREVSWRDLQPFLQSRGYMLRPRFHPDWTPSWLASGRHPLFSEDGVPLSLASHTMDATRIADGKMVYIKRVKTTSPEVSTAQALYAEPLRSDPTNHTVPVLDTFDDPKIPGLSYMVMPFLRFPDDPAFERVSEVVEFMTQILEGLVFMHDQGVAHRDCCMGNIMMDASAMYPDGHHPVKMSRALDGLSGTRELSRSRVPARYYFIDYGISSVYRPGQPRELVTGTDGRDQAVPELSKDVPYDPFPLDIFLIGNMLGNEFLAKYTNTGFLSRIAIRAVHPVPAKRPDARELLKLWTAERTRIPYLKKAWRLRGRDEVAA